MSDIFDLYHPDYTARKAEWEYAEGAYGADYLSVPTASADGTVTASMDITRAARYLPRVPLGEAIERYRYMLATLDPDGLFPFALGSLAGQVAAVEPDAARNWGAATDDGDASPFGDPEDSASVAHRLLRDADGKGTDWDAIWIQSATDLLLYQGLWYAVKGVHTVEVPLFGDATGGVERPPAVERLLPSAVPYWKTVGGIMVEAHAASHKMESTGSGAGKKILMRRVYKLGGYEDWEKPEGGEATQVGEGVRQQFFADAGGKVPCLPIFRADLGLRYYVAYVLARKAMAMTNQSARGDVATLTGTIARLVHKSNEPTPTNGTHKFITSIADGASVHVIGTEESVEYVEPGMGAAAEARARAEWKREQFMQEAYQRFGDAAREATATEVRQSQRTGSGAILSLLSSTLDEAEQKALWLLAQAEAPDRSEAWGVASVERSRDFVAVDEAERADKRADRVFGGQPVPIGTTGRKNAALDYGRSHGLALDEAEVEADVAAFEASGGRVSPRQLDATREALVVEDTDLSL